MNRIKQLRIDQARTGQTGSIEYLTTKQKIQDIYDLSGKIASDKCKKLNVSYRHSSTISVKNYLFGLIKLVRVIYYY